MSYGASRVFSCFSSLELRRLLLMKSYFKSSKITNKQPTVYSYGPPNVLALPGRSSGVQRVVHVQASSYETPWLDAAEAAIPILLFHINVSMDGHLHIEMRWMKCIMAQSAPSPQRLVSEYKTVAKSLKWRVLKWIWNSITCSSGFSGLLDTPWRHITIYRTTQCGTGSKALVLGYFRPKPFWNKTL